VYEGRIGYLRLKKGINGGQNCPSRRPIGAEKNNYVKIYVKK
jgi:hypothetical protein